MKRQDLSFLEAVSEIDFARLAAYIDGEGCLRIDSNKGAGPTARRVYYMQLTVTNTDFRLLDWLVKTFKGSVSVSRKNTIGRLPCGAWLVASRHASAIIERCSPYMIVKKDQAEIAMSFAKTILPDRRYGRSGRPVEIIQAQALMAERMSALKDPGGHRRSRRKEQTHSVTIQ